MKKKIKDIIKNPGLLFISLGHRGAFCWMKDEQYLKIAYRIKIGKKLNLNNPLTYNEKLQWLKLYNRDSKYKMMVDKYEVKKWISETIGDKYIIPTLGVWDCFEDIDFSKLPERFVLKCTHDSGGLVICKDKNTFNIRKAKKIINSCLKHNYYWGQREWPYKDVKPRILAEEYMEDSSDQELRDYKFFAFDGRVHAMFIATDRSDSQKETCFDFFDENFNHLDIKNGHPNALHIPHKPENFEEMRKIAEKLSRGIPQVRIDLYDVNGKVYFGEMTFFHWSGLKRFEPEKWDRIFGDWIQLPDK